MVSNFGWNDSWSLMIIRACFMCCDVWSPLRSSSSSRQKLHWCMMRCSWSLWRPSGRHKWPWAPCSATDTNPGGTARASWTCLKRWEQDPKNVSLLIIIHLTLGYCQNSTWKCIFTIINFPIALEHKLTFLALKIEWRDPKTLLKLIKIILRHMLLFFFVMKNTFTFIYLADLIQSDSLHYTIYLFLSMSNWCLNKIDILYIYYIIT